MACSVSRSMTRSGRPFTWTWTEIESKAPETTKPSHRDEGDQRPASPTVSSRVLSQADTEDMYIDDGASKDEVETRPSQTETPTRKTPQPHGLRKWEAERERWRAWPAGYVRPAARYVLDARGFDDLPDEFEQPVQLVEMVELLAEDWQSTVVADEGPQPQRINTRVQPARMMPAARPKDPGAQCRCMPPLSCGARTFCGKLAAVATKKISRTFSQRKRTKSRAESAWLSPLADSRMFMPLANEKFGSVMMALEMPAGEPSIGPAGPSSERELRLHTSFVGSLSRELSNSRADTEHLDGSARNSSYQQCGGRARLGTSQPPSLPLATSQQQDDLMKPHSLEVSVQEPRFEDARRRMFSGSLGREVVGKQTPSDERTRIDNHSGGGCGRPGG